MFLFKADHKTSKRVYEMEVWSIESFYSTEEKLLLSQNKKIILCGICTLEYYKSSVTIKDKEEHATIKVFYILAVWQKRSNIHKHKLSEF